ncbi:gram-negative bacteria-binding protein 1-like isoform X2 [Anastrepha obliqua]|uniref:gram-negative bacteria-binding protein 1-like isoform X2 n=1 Tax=Anastrepha obliqua TaxID=95512 RepID=UPI0024091759|nr:gram-negative bacteria-binding protein 1-like isoform X2 [Anastrepha obliqua]
MHNFIFYIFLVWLSCLSDLTVMCYKIPEVKLDVLPNGFRVSIPHEPGIENVAFNINRNRPFKAFEPGEYSHRIRTQINNLWFFETQRRLQDDDTIYVWTDVQFNKSRYRDMSTPIAVNYALRGQASQSGASTIPPMNAVSQVPQSVNEIAPTTTTEEPPTIDQRNDKCEPSLTTIHNRKVCRGQLIFEENFDGDQLDASRWRYEVRLPLDIADAEFVLYDTNAELSNGLLKIEPRLWGNDSPNADIQKGDLNLGARCTAYQNPEVECQRHPFGRVVLPPVLSARINTKHAFSFKYGRVEVRAKLPQGDWLFPLLLLEPLVNYYGQQPYASGQMRIAFLRSNLNLQTGSGVEVGGRVLHGGAVLCAESNNRDKFMVNTSRGAHFGESFHIYSLTWNDRLLSLDVDGQNYGTVEGGYAQIVNDFNNAWANGNYMAPFDQEFFITLGVAAGGHGDFPDEYSSKPWVNSSPKAALYFWRDRHNWKSTWISPALQVDYVRVYAI